MKIALFGATGKIGSQVASQLENKSHEIVRIGSRSGDITVDYTNGSSVENALKQTAPLDAVLVSVGGDSVFKDYHELTDDDFRHGAERKLVAQFRIVLLAEKYLSDGGSITLTSGFLSHYPNPHSLATGPFNAAIDTFVQQAAPLLQRGIRLNVVSPAPIVEPASVGKGLVSADQVAELFIQSVEGGETGQIYRAWGGLAVT
ncbi:MAG: short chain dehydrogenase [Candidatus Thiodiazotropha sp. (ex Codakia rugifera)]|nr:short chain dehydrogenase [Candidatus Thiodiazotropha sp. (ex Codakia rugifera)]